MAFNLDKSGGEKPKFNLAKSTEASSPNPLMNEPEPERKKPFPWLVTLIVIALLGVGGWYFLVDRASSTNASGASDSVAAAQGDSSSVADQSSSLAATDPVGTTTDSAAATAAAAVPSATREELNNTVPATFAPGGYEPLEVDRALITKVTDFLNANPDSKLVVRGYASSEGDLALNKRLSVQRAEAFKSMLIKAGIPADLIRTSGEGVSNPIATNDTEAGRRRNRRVEISI